MFNIIDRYIIRKFLGTYCLSIILIISVAVVFDISEKLNYFIANDVPTQEIIFDYYLNFIPFFATLFSPMFVFISVIFITSKMAENTEITAILASGVSFNRLMFPYFISALIIASSTFLLNAYVIPKGNETRLIFENERIRNRTVTHARNIQLEVKPGIVVYMERYNNLTRRGFGFSMEKFEERTLVSRMTAREIKFDTLYRWTVSNYLIRNFDGLTETMERGESRDTIIMFEPADFMISRGMHQQMTLPELRNYLDRQRARGVGNIKDFALEYHKRFAFPLAAFILTLIGVSLSSQKKKGGIGVNLAIGLLLSFSYILFTTVSSTFAVSGSLSPFWAVWIPNFIYLAIGIGLYLRAPK